VADICQRMRSCALTLTDSPSFCQLVLSADIQEFMRIRCVLMKPQCVSRNNARKTRSMT
jgi:hypothetical protein